MSSWVAPELAAELWGTTIDDILDRICAGELRTREEGGFIFIDVNAPRLRPENRPPTVIPATADTDAPLNFQAARARTRLMRTAPRAAA